MSGRADDKPERPVVPIRAIRLEDRPREKGLAQGVRSLSDEELLTILIRSGTQRLSAIDIAKSLLAMYGGHLDRLYRDFVDNAHPAIDGLGRVKLITIAAGMELGMRATRELVDPQRGAEPVEASNSLRIYRYIAERLTGLSEEQLWLLCFDRKNAITHSKSYRIKAPEEILRDEDRRSRRSDGSDDCPLTARQVAEAEARRRAALPMRQMISSGGYQETSADLRVILREALRHPGVLGIAVVHNHPGGSLEPSKEDDRFTRRLYEACRVVGVPLLDHLIYTDRGYYSYFDHYRLEG